MESFLELFLQLMQIFSWEGISYLPDFLRRNVLAFLGDLDGLELIGRSAFSCDLFGTC
jgi:hypothetical protein